MERKEEKNYIYDTDSSIKLYRSTKHFAQITIVQFNRFLSNYTKIILPIGTHISSPKANDIMGMHGLLN